MATIDSFPIQTIDLAQVDAQGYPDMLLCVKAGEVVQDSLDLVNAQLASNTTVSDEISNVLCVSDDSTDVYQTAPEDVVKAGLTALGKLNATALFTGQKDGGGSSLALSEAKSHFEFVLYVFRTNNEQTSVLLPSVQSKPCISVAIGPWESSTNCMKYNAYFEIVFSDQVNAVCNDSYNNAGLRLHLINVYGINRVSF